MGMAAFTGQSIPQSIPRASEMGEAAWMARVGGQTSQPVSLSKNRLCPSCSDQPTQAGGGRVADSSSGWGVCKSCPREGWVLGPHHAIQRQDGQDHSTAALSPTVNRGGKEPATNGSFIMISL